MKQHLNFKSRFRILKGGKISLMVSVLLGSVTLSVASPTDGTVTSGTANISQNGNITNINQSTQKASINWNNFSIKSNETINFNQPNSSSITLNRVVGNEKSVIDGALNANGQVWILNSNGILFNSSAKVNTAGLLATTAELSDKDFQDGNYNFKNATSNSVINLGTIEVTNNAYVVLASNEVKNTGTLKAIKGKVHLTGADSYSLNLNGNSIVNLVVDKGVLDSLVENSGSIIADGGEIYLTTNAVNELLKGIVNNTGILEANSLNGLTGKVEVFAHGGTANVSGTIEAKGGFVETSGKELSVANNTVIKAKKWLIDPVDVTIEASGGNDVSGASISATAIETALATADVTIEATHDINVNQFIDIAHNSLVLIAGNDININQNINVHSVLNTDGLALLAGNNININATIDVPSQNTLLFMYGFDGSSFNDTGHLNIAMNADKTAFIGRINLANDALLNINAEDYTIISNAAELAAITTGDNSTKYALGSDITSGMTNWTPISGIFQGKFNGLGHIVNNLTINTSLLDAGLFEHNEGTISNIGLTNATVITTANEAGILVGRNDGEISNSYSTGTITGSGQVGGLVGINSKTISKSHSSATVTGEFKVGGLVGSSSGSQSIIEDSYATGNVFGIDGFEIGGLVGYSVSDSTSTVAIKNSYATGDVSCNDCNSVGGLIGYGETELILNSYAIGDVSGQHSVGGLVGNDYDITIENSHAIGNVSGEDNVGGLVGANYYTTIENSYATGDVSGDDSVGGLIGYSEDTTHTRQSYATGNVSGRVYVGGLVGYNFLNTTIENSYATGDVVGDGTVGGLIGYNEGTNTQQSYAIGNVSGNSYVGGLVGRNTDVTITGSFYNKTLNPNLSDESTYGKTTTEMQTLSTYTTAGWDIAGNDGAYPTISNSSTLWSMNGISPNPTPNPEPIIPTPEPTVTPTPVTPTNNINVNKVITSIVNTNVLKVEVPKIIQPIIQPQVVKTTINPNIDMGFIEGTNVTLVSQPKNDEPTKMITMTQLKSMQKNESQETNTNTVNDVRVSVGDNSVIDLINGGVNLPLGVEQEFYVVKENENQKN